MAESLPFDLDDGRELTGTVSDAEGREDMRISVRREGQAITVRESGSRKAWRVLLRNAHDTLII